MNGKYKVGDVVLDNWTLVRLLGEGAYGRVYEAHREDFGTTYTAAIKIMTIPSSQSEVESVRAEGMDEAAVMAYFRGMAEDVVREFVLMSELKGSTNIVSCEDHAVVPHTEGVGWDIFIRMELLTPMLRYMSGHEMTRSDIIKLGVDMCRALELCQRYNIIHRDIKPENIFVSRAGDYKLGDFGVARTLEKTTGGLSKKGTYTYMAPEIYRDEPYGSTVDIYSLGIVLYRLLNNNRPPFLPPPPQPVSYSEREQALLRRVGGEQIPPPANAEGRLAEIVLKACAYEAKERYTSPLLMRRELEAIQYPRGKDELIYGRDEKIRVERSAFTGQGKTDAEATIYTPRGKNSPPEAPKKKKKTGLIAGVAAALVLAAAALALLPKLRRAETDAAPAAETPAPAAQTAAPAGETPIPVEETHAPAEEPAEPTPEPAPEPEEAAWVEGEWDWSLNGSTLTISGTGNMANYSETSPAPWPVRLRLFGDLDRARRYRKHPGGRHRDRRPRLFQLPVRNAAQSSEQPPRDQGLRVLSMRQLLQSDDPGGSRLHRSVRVLLFRTVSEGDRPGKRRGNRARRPPRLGDADRGRGRQSELQVRRRRPVLKGRRQAAVLSRMADDRALHGPGRRRRDL